MSGPVGCGLVWQTAAVITVVGEALVDLLISPAGDVEAALGGAPFNTARAGGRLGADVEFVGALSTDRFGTLLAEQLAADGVSTERAPRVVAPTTLAAAELDESGAAAYRFYIDGTSAPALTSVDGGGEVWFTGGLGLVLEPMAASVEAAVDVASASGRLVMVDVNCRPLVVPDRSEYVARVERVVHNSHILKVSDDDLDYLSPGVAPIDAARSLLAAGPSVVLVTAGAAGVHLVTPSAERFVPATPVEVVDTVGAGDTFGAGFLVDWCSGGDVHDLDDIDRLAGAAAFGARVAAVVVGRRGADPPWSAELIDV